MFNSSLMETSMSDSGRRASPMAKELIIILLALFLLEDGKWAIFKAMESMSSRMEPCIRESTTKI